MARTIVGRWGVAASLTTPTAALSTFLSNYTERLADAGIEPSVGSVGDSYDNGLAETINGLDKTEVIHWRRPWRSFETVEYAALEWVDWFNIDLAAWVTSNGLRQTRGVAAVAPSAGSDKTGTPLVFRRSVPAAERERRCV